MGDVSQSIISFDIKTFEDVLLARKKAREILEQYQFSTLDQTKYITAISELLRNVLIHAGNGKVEFLKATKNLKIGILTVISDRGPGIPDLNKALMEGYSSVGSLGLGLSGAKNLCDEFQIKSIVGEGTTVQIAKWN